MNKVKNRQLEMMNLKGVFILLMDYSPVYSPDANMDGIDILGSKDETQTSYLKDDLEVFFLGSPRIFDSDLKRFFENILSRKRILITSYFQEKLQHHLKRLLGFCKRMVIWMIF